MKFEFLPAFKGDCFFIHAGTDSKPVLILVDGGPGGTYQNHLRPRLSAFTFVRFRTPIASSTGTRRAIRKRSPW